MNPALWAAIIAAQQTCVRTSVSYGQPWWAEKSTLPRWPRLLIWLIRRRTQRRHDGKTWIKLDDWLWDRYFEAITNKKPAAANDNDGMRNEKAA